MTPGQTTSHRQENNMNVNQMTNLRENKLIVGCGWIRLHGKGVRGQWTRLKMCSLARDSTSLNVMFLCRCSWLSIGTSHTYPYCTMRLMLDTTHDRRLEKELSQNSDLMKLEITQHNWFQGLTF